ncbi:MAG TPA: class I tRNA ligase family protein, partial [Nocardioides sp.]|nr:class I tRNA ligase family protein [Nocardioides sp.]
RPMTRDIDWGIPVPLEGWRDLPTKRLYVWFDAVIGYLSASIEWARRISQQDGGDPERWREWWNDPQTRSYYFMGKDNIVFHSQIWPAELLAYNCQGDKGGEPGPYGTLNLPTEVVSSEFLTFGDSQFSTSRGNVIYVGDFLARYGPDALRYYICAAGPETSDAAFTWADFVTRNNSELVAGWGNLVNRTATMIAKSFGEIPAAGPFEPVDEAVLEAVRKGFDIVGDLVGRQRLRHATAEAMRVVGEVNKYLTATEPYKMKDEAQRERLATVLHVAAQCVLDCNTILAPFLPFSANAVHRIFGGDGELMPMPRIEHVEDLDPDDGAGLGVYPIITGDYSATPRWESRPVTVGAKVEKPTPLFTKLDPAVVDEELARLDA